MIDNIKEEDFLFDTDNELKAYEISQLGYNGDNNFDNMLWKNIIWRLWSDIKVSAKYCKKSNIKIS